MSVNETSHEHPLVIPCLSNRVSGGYDEWLRVDATSPGLVRICHMKRMDGHSAKSDPDPGEHLLLTPSAVELLVSRLQNWLDSRPPRAKEEEKSCENACTKNNSPLTAPTSESNVSNSESMEEMVSRIARSCIREALLGSSNSSSPAKDCGPNRDCGSGI